MPISEGFENASHRLSIEPVHHYSAHYHGACRCALFDKGFVTTFNYNARGLEESRTEAFDRPEARTVTTTWHPTLNLRATVSEPARITTYHYDPQGRATGQTVTER